LGKVSSILQYLSFETIETMLYSMKSLNIGKLKKEFLTITAFHGQKFCEEINKLDIEDNIKESFCKLVNEFMKDLFEMAEFDPLKDADNSFQ
jgi:hypothetical protein